MAFGRTRRLLAELRDLRSDTRDLIGQLRDLRAETKDLRAETTLELARNREEPERGREALRRIEKEFELNREQHERGLRTYDRLEAFTDDLMRRSEQTHRELIREMRDLRDEARAQREGFWALIDRLFPKQPPEPNEG